MDKVAVVAGEMMLVTCPVAGYPIETIQWEKGILGLIWRKLENSPLKPVILFCFAGGRVLPVNRRQQVFPNGTLIIENVQRSLDQGSYTCLAKNAQGFSAKGNLEVQVMGKFFYVPVNLTAKSRRDFIISLGNFSKNKQTKHDDSLPSHPNSELVRIVMKSPPPLRHAKCASAYKNLSAFG